jgi:hypothetical protein
MELKIKTTISMTSKEIFQWWQDWLLCIWNIYVGEEESKLCQGEGLFSSEFLLCSHISSLHWKNGMRLFKASSPPLFRESDRYGEMGYVAAGERLYTTHVILWEIKWLCQKGNFLESCSVLDSHKPLAPEDFYFSN